MDIVVIFFIIVLLIIIYILIDCKNEKIKNEMKYFKLMNMKNIKKNNFKNQYQNNFKSSKIFNKIVNEDIMLNNDLRNINNCKVPTLTTGQCFKSRFNKCNNKNGSFQQCTNNIMPTNFNALCENRAFELARPEHKVSENCSYYYDLN